MHSSQVRTQNETPTATRTSELAACISGTDKFNNQLEDDGKRGRGTGREQQRQQQNGQAPAVNLHCLQWQRLAAEFKGTTDGYGDRRQRQAVAVAVAAALMVAVLTGGCGGGGRLWRRRKEQRQQSRVILWLC